MKAITQRLLLAIFLLSYFSLYAQTEYVTDYEIQYEAKYSLDSLNLDTKTIEVFYLYTGKEYGVFMNHNTAHQDEIKAYNKEQMQFNNRSASTKSVSRETNYRRTFFKNRESNEIKVEAQILDETYLYKEPSVPLDWKIVDESKEYFDYTVQKATTSFAGRDYVAWFAVEIPINDGPYIFYGLPGLIVELYDTEEHYYFSLLNLEKLSEPKTWKIQEDIKEVSRGEFKEVEPRGIENLALMQNVASVSINDGAVTLTTKDGKDMSQAEFDRMLRRRVRDKNNWIEKE